jgi:hypothetical protein
MATACSRPTSVSSMLPYGAWVTSPCLTSFLIPSDTVEGLTPRRSAMTLTDIGVSDHSVADQISFK